VQATSRPALTTAEISAQTPTIPLPDGKIRMIYALKNYGGSTVTSAVDGGTSRRTVSMKAPDLTPLVILINENTASASEIVAGAMQDHDRALIVGQTSFGKGLVQSIIPLEYGAGLTLTSAKYFTPSGRLIQRDYSNGGFYDYYTHGAGVGRPTEPAKPSGPESKTDTGRAVYGGGGISPDETVGARTVNLAQRRLLSPTFAFAREFVNGRIRGFETNRIAGIDFNHELCAA